MVINIYKPSTGKIISTYLTTLITDDYFKYLYNKILYTIDNINRLKKSIYIIEQGDKFIYSLNDEEINILYHYVNDIDRSPFKYKKIILFKLCQHPAII